MTPPLQQNPHQSQQQNPHQYAHRLLPWWGMLQLATAAKPPTPPKNRRGFTLLEVLVATLIMGVAVVTLLSGVSTSLRNAARLSDYDRAVVLGRAKLDQLLADSRIPRNTTFEGAIDSKLFSGAEGGWQARVTPFERQPNGGAGSYALERLELEIWWKRGDNRRSYRLESYRPFMLKPQDLAALATGASQ